MWKLNFVPVHGCSPVEGDRGCQNCDAAEFAHRHRHKDEYRGLTRQTSRGVPPEWNGRVVVDEWRLPTFRSLPPGEGTVWLCPTGDLYHEDVPFEFLAELNKAMLARPDVTFWCTTRRAARLREVLDKVEFPTTAGHIRYGVPVSSEADLHRVADLAHARCPARYIEYAPALGPIDWRQIFEGGGFGLVVAAGETGPFAEPTNPWLLRELRDACRMFRPRIKFAFRGWGEFLPFDQIGEMDVMDLDATPIREADDPDGVMPCNRVGRQRSGRFLDCETHDGDQEEQPMPPPQPPRAA